MTRIIVHVAGRGNDRWRVIGNPMMVGEQDRLVSVWVLANLKTDVIITENVENCVMVWGECA